MQSINVAIINPMFLTVFVGTTAICTFVVVASLLRWHDSGVVYLILDSVLYLVDSYLVTVLFNVSKNNAPASVSPDNPDSTSLWATYLEKWTTWNRGRTITALAAMAPLFIVIEGRDDRAQSLTEAVRRNYSFFFWINKQHRSPVRQADS